MRSIDRAQRSQLLRLLGRTAPRGSGHARTEHEREASGQRVLLLTEASFEGVHVQD